MKHTQPVCSDSTRLSHTSQIKTDSQCFPRGKTAGRGADRHPWDTVTRGLAVQEREEDSDVIRKSHCCLYILPDGTAASVTTGVKINPVGRIMVT
ncbi:hypothetical protein Baya_10088 [Bagarius yarrelli]|uniref:Uncharacterized protein n=1 Tax=Bagarius yarrelli TaxID=175774 RepID=A0A556UEU5_BAGYA|nr:hypothetical protein Baya_10088 [Bagarius yarrelli]